MAVLALAFLSALSTVIGGLLPVYTRVRRVPTRYLLGFAAGVMVSVALLVMLPEVAEQEGASFIALAVIVHEFPRGFTTSVIMQGAGYRRVRVLGALALDALLTPLAAGLVLLGLFPQSLYGPLFSFAAGAFLYVGASDL
ncbi:MAG TPA: ZIP family metal transporter, partial [Dehalococcoidia bacterium]|nr:ZIP family metal transporter [Dehalococcoidia bacterium]